MGASQAKIRLREAACLPLFFGGLTVNKKACVFVDGENFRHSIADLFEDFDRKEHLPKRADWCKLFDWFVSEVAGADAERVRTYWYVIEHIDFFPYKFPDPARNPDQLKNLLSKHRKYEKELGKLKGDGLVKRMAQIVTELKRGQGRMRRRFDGWTTLQNGIASRHAAVEFRRAGAIGFNLFDWSFGKEKAVDVKLATDLFMLREIYDVAVIVSGDQDYVPAVQLVKDSGKRVVNVAFKTRNGRLLPGGAWRLNQHTDWSLAVPYDVFRPFLNLDAEPTADKDDGVKPSPDATAASS